MIEAKIYRDDGILQVSPTGKLETDDFEQLRLLADPYIETHGTLNGLLIDAKSFPWWEDFASMLAHFRFLRGLEDTIPKVAAVTDSGFLTILPAVANYFTAAEVRHFDYSDRDEAIEWLRGASTSD